MAMDKTKGWKIASLALVALAALSAFRLAAGWRGSRAPEAQAAPVDGSGGAEGFRWTSMDAALWRVFRSGEPPAPQSSAGALAARYRLAGVFLILSGPERSGGEDRCAILDDLQAGRQVLATEEEWIDQVRVVRVESDHVVLSDGSHEETIVLAAGTLPGRDRAGTPIPPKEDLPILESNRFGNRVGETRWEIRRESVMEYYQEMMDNPERLASLFLAMRADRDAEGRVDGYRLDMEAGEKDFYSQVGLRNGDVVRRVNSMRMTSQRRAEYFIGEFVQGRLDAVVIDIEREGKPEKLVYLVK